MEGDGRKRRGELALLTAEELRASAAMLLPATLPFKLKQAESRSVKNHKRLKTILQQEEYHLLPASEPTYVSIEAPPSLYPPKKYCDLTGQPARYTDPVTKLRFADAAAFDAVRRLPPDAVQRYLALRRAAIVLK